MVTDIRPPGVKTKGKSKVTIVPTIADPAAPTDDELNAGVTIECYLPPGGWAVTATDNIETDERYCDDEVPQSIGTTTWAIATVDYLYDPQGDGTENGNKAFGAMTKGNLAWAVQRDGIDVGDTYDVGDVLTFV